jgi:hypothetical protein
MSQNNEQAAKVRLINAGRTSSVAKARQALYRSCTARIKEAIKLGFYLEAIALLESMITDRLESRIAAIHGQDENYRKFRTIGHLLHGRVYKDKSKNVVGLLNGGLGEPNDLIDVYREINEWSNDRNVCLHQMVKLDGKSDKEWEPRIAYAEKTAKSGQKIFRSLSRLIDMHNKSLLGISASTTLPPIAGSAIDA